MSDTWYQDPPPPYLDWRGNLWTWDGQLLNPVHTCERPPPRSDWHQETGYMDIETVMRRTESNISQIRQLWFGEWVAPIREVRSMTEEVLVISADSRWTPETFERVRFAVARAQMERWGYTDTLDDADAWVQRTAASENLVCDVHAVLEELAKLGLLLPPGGKTRVEFGVDAWMFGNPDNRPPTHIAVMEGPDHAQYIRGVTEWPDGDSEKIKSLTSGWRTIKEVFG